MTSVIPAQLLYVAAQFSALDDYKQMLTCVNVKKDQEKIQITSTDGHRAFRVTFETNAHYYMGEDEVNILAKTVKKRVGKARYAKIRDNVVEYTDINRSMLMINPTEHHKGDFPDVNSVWPTEYNNDPHLPIGFNPRLLSEFLVEVSRFGVNCMVKMETNNNHEQDQSGGFQKHNMLRLQLKNIQLLRRY